MRTIPPDLAAHLAGAATTLCRCWRATRSDGQVFGFTDHDRDIAFDGTNFRAATGLDAAQTTGNLSFAVGGGEVVGAFSDAAVSAADLAAGLWDSAQVEIFLVNWSTPEQNLRLFVGTIGEVRRDDGAFTAELRGPATSVNQSHGRLFAPTCDADLGDVRCTMNLDTAAFKGAGLVTVVEDGFSVLASGLGAFAANWFRGGRIAWLSGANAGLGSEVRQHAIAGAAARLALWQETPFPAAVGDSFTIVAGCDKYAETCRAKFANIANFRGFPQMPGTDRVLAYPPADGSGQSGGSYYQ